MIKKTFIHYYVQVLEQDKELPKVVYHTHDKKNNQYYYQFIEKKRAKELAEAEKKITPENKFRVVKCTQNYFHEEWF